MKANDAGELAARLFEVMEILISRAGTSWLDVLDESGATPGQLKALGALATRDAPVSVGELAGRLSLSAPTASRIADALCQLGFLERTVSAEDRRARDLAVTPAGHELIRRLTEARVADLRVVVDGLTDAQRGHLSAALAELGVPASEGMLAHA